MIFEPGQLLGDRFRLINQLSPNGGAWRAVDRVPERQVVIERIEDPGRRARQVLGELWRVSTICDRSVARVHAVGRFDDGDLWLAREALIAESLEDLLLRQQQIGAGAALALFADLGHALAAAHSRDVVHGAISARSIKLHCAPGCVMVPKLVDFGRAAGDSLADGSASPEVLNSGRAGCESDVWSLGVLLFRCITGRMPFTASSAMARLAEVYGVERILANAGLDEQVERLLLDALRPARASRITAEAFADRAQLLAWTTRTALAEIDKLVCITDEACPGAELSGVLDRFSPSPTNASDHQPSEPELPSDPSLAPDDRPTPRLDSYVPELPQYMTPWPDEQFVDFVPRPRYGVVALVMVAAAAIAIAAIIPARPKRAILGDVALQLAAMAAPPPAAKRANAPATVNPANQIATATVANAPAEAEAVATAKPEAAAQPVVIESPPIVIPRAVAHARPAQAGAPTPQPVAPASTEPAATEPAPKIGAVSGIPRWNPKPVSDNPYE